MASLLKDVYDTAFFDHFTTILANAAPKLDKKVFLAAVHDEQWPVRELKQRMKHIAAVLHQMLPGTYEHQLRSIERIIAHLSENRRNDHGFEYMFFAEFVELFGLPHVPASLRAMEFITQFTSCEFAVRPFIKAHPEQLMQQMLSWSEHPQHTVRRFSSEGCRPRLPWGMALHALQKDPKPVLPILENLKNDPSEFVRRSVANNLNDIAKDHPELVLQLAKKWLGHSAETDWVVKHGCRTLLKRGHAEALGLFGWSAVPSVQIKNLALKNNTFPVGAYLEFAFDLQHDGATPCDLRLEYAIDYLKSNGKHNRKVFKITENTYNPGEVYRISRRQSFQDMTTRKHYPGVHRLTIVVNGKDSGSVEFEIYKD
ncbi:MAG: DNA alkylation repair protein [Saprospiraceae bacterium]|nr:DNA alkylation repair protein [Saprospiraceae bacterium]